jgi:hypothetical protein
MRDFTLMKNVGTERKKCCARWRKNSGKKFTSAHTMQVSRNAYRQRRLWACAAGGSTKDGRPICERVHTERRRPGMGYGRDVVRDGGAHGERDYEADDHYGADQAQRQNELHDGTR